jgi:hypothetical protein
MPGPSMRRRASVDRRSGHSNCEVHVALASLIVPVLAILGLALGAMIAR